jgi:hypothetical protein
MSLWGFTIHDAIALLNGGLANGLSEMTLAGAGRAEKQAVLMFGDEVGRGQVEDEAAVHLLVEVEVEVIERLLWIAELGGLSATVQQTVTATIQFIGNEARDEINRRHALGLSLMKTCFQDGGDAAETKLF